MQQHMDEFVIPAKAGIQSAAVSGFRVKPGMTLHSASIDFNMSAY
jgi:hypothetical protein